MTIPLEDWHRRFQQQAGWTAALRTHIFRRAGAERSRRILEVGCGTGALSSSISDACPGVQVVGVDLDLPRMRFACRLDSRTRYAGGDARRLPFGDGSFDLTFCHYLLLWVREPEAALREMVRVTKPGGWVAALAEPDYGARIDYPPPLAELGRRQADSLRRQGADPEFGRKLAGLFSGSGICVQESGVLGSQIDPGGEGSAEEELEWKILKEDVGDEISGAAWQSLREADRDARKNGRRILFVPTFYAAGKTPEFVRAIHSPKKDRP
jgi:SAM-dependent methyltransferase